jgi:quercetin dioxygenase-like cupin family protein
METSKLHRWKEIEPDQMNPLTTRQYIVGTNTMLARLVLKKGAHVPLHSHMHEQISQVVEGTLEFLLEGKSVIVRRARSCAFRLMCRTR